MILISVESTSKDIYEYLLELEARPVYTIRENFLSNQVDVSKHPGRWLVQVHQRFLLVPETLRLETLHLTIDILDKSLEVTNDRMKSSRVTDRHRVPIAPRESRYVRVTAVKQTKSDNEKCLKSTTRCGHPSGPTACTHPTTNTTSSKAAATRVTRKIKTSIPPPAVCHRAVNRQRSLKSTCISMPDVVAEAVPCPKTQIESKVSSLDLADSVVVKVERQPQQQRKDVPDPDIGTKGDPYLCGEYIKDIYEYLLELETRPVYTIRENFLSNQVEVSKRHRNILVDWLVQVHQRFLLVPETLYLTIDIMDRSLQVSSYSNCYLFPVANYCLLVGIECVTLSPSSYEAISKNNACFLTCVQIIMATLHSSCRLQ